MLPRLRCHATAGFEPKHPLAQRQAFRPVRDDAPFFDTSTIHDENLGRMGRGKGVSPDQVEDDLVGIDGGVLSR